MTETPPFPCELPQQLRVPVLNALHRVVDPELALDIVDVGLVYGVHLEQERELHVQVTMTSAACPVAETIVGDIEHELDQVLPEDLLIRVQLVWEPPWTPQRMSQRAMKAMGW